MRPGSASMTDIACSRLGTWGWARNLLAGKQGGGAKAASNMRYHNKAEEEGKEERKWSDGQQGSWAGQSWQGSWAGQSLGSWSGAWETKGREEEWQWGAYKAEDTQTRYDDWWGRSTASTPWKNWDWSYKCDDDEQEKDEKKQEDDWKLHYVNDEVRDGNDMLQCN